MVQPFSASGRPGPGSPTSTETTRQHAHTAAHRDDGALRMDSSVAALVPHYRCERWLANCLESLVAQTRPPNAIIVIDDASKSPPVEIVRRFPSVTLLTATENSGPYRLVQQVINTTAYDGYMFQDADDWSSRDRLEILLAEASRSGAELVGTQEARVLAELGEIVTVNYPLDVNAALEERPWEYALLHPSSLMSRALNMRLGGFATGLRFSGDLELLQRAVHAGRVVNVPHHCYFRLERPGSLTMAPNTGLRSRDRLDLWQRLQDRAIRNAAAAANGTPDLSPYELAPPIELTHVLGPVLAPIGPRA